MFQITLSSFIFFEPIFCFIAYRIVHSFASFIYSVLYFVCLKLIYKYFPNSKTSMMFYSAFRSLSSQLRISSICFRFPSSSLCFCVQMGSARKQMKLWITETKSKMSYSHSESRFTWSANPFDQISQNYIPIKNCDN